jgi:acyl-CoA thioester hydrolase
MDAPSVETTFHVRYAETDAMGFVHHSVYPVWFEEARSEFLRQRGTNYAEVEAAGYFFAMSEMKVRFHAPARYGHAVTVRAWVERVRSRGVTFGYEVRHAETGQRLVTGYTKMLCLDRQGRPHTVPPWFWEAIGKKRDSPLTMS